MTGISIETQKAIIGSLIVRPQLYYEMKGVAPFMFDEGQKDVFENVLSQIEDRSHVDTVILSEFFSRNGIPGEVSGYTRQVNPGRFGEYVSLATKGYMRRELRALSLKLTEDLEGGMDPDEATEKFYRESEMLQDMVIGSGGHEVSERNVHLMEAMNQKKKAKPTFSVNLNKYLKGYSIGSMDLYAGRPGMGKSTIMRTMAYHLAKEGTPVCIITLEMTRSDIYSLIACQIAQIDSNIIEMDEDEVKSLTGKDKTEYEEAMGKYTLAYDELSEIPLYVYDESDTGPSDDQIVNFIRKEKRKNDVEYYFIDYLTRIKPTLERSKFYQTIGGISDKFSRLPKQLGIYIGMFAQLSRAVETRGGSKRPILSDLRESGNIEEDGFAIIFLYRPEYYQILESEEGISTKGIMEMIIAKNRKFKHLGTARLKYNPITQMYEDFKKDQDQFNQTPPNLYNHQVNSKVNSDDDIPF
jgi:replicative DNA helicase